MVYKTKKTKAKTQHHMSWTPLHVASTNNLNKTSTFLETTGGKDESNIMQLSSPSRIDYRS
jgi:hypothetical protein